MFARILLFGYGTMASAMLEGWLKSGLEPSRFTVYNPRPKPVPDGVAFYHVADNSEAFGREHAADLARHRRALGFVDVEQRDPDALVRQRARRGFPQTRRAAGDDGGNS